MAQGFGENFKRDETEDNLNYDDTAFFYFALAMLTVLLLPATYVMVIRPMTQGEMIINTNIKNCKCKICTKRMEKR